MQHQEGVAEGHSKKQRVMNIVYTHRLYIHFLAKEFLTDKDYFVPSPYS